MTTFAPSYIESLTTHASYPIKHILHLENAKREMLGGSVKNTTSLDHLAVPGGLMLSAYMATNVGSEGGTRPRKEKGEIEVISEDMYEKLFDSMRGQGKPKIGGEGPQLDFTKGKINPLEPLPSNGTRKYRRESNNETKRNN